MPASILGLALVGEPRPTALAELADYPDGLAEILASWGPGRLCDVFELRDPSDARRELLVSSRARAERVRGKWAQIPEERFAAMRIVGVDRRGAALTFFPPRKDLHLLTPRGHVIEIESVEALVGDFLLGGIIDRTRTAHLCDGSTWHWLRRSEVVQGSWDLGVPAVYINVERAPMRPILQALERGDEHTADACLERYVEHRVVLQAQLELLEALISPAADRIPPELRRDYVAQLSRRVRRRAPDATGELTVEALLDPPEGPFVPGASVVAADPLTLTPVDAPAIDDERRGFVAPAGMGPILGDEMVAGLARAWQRDDPAADIAPLLSLIAALDPRVRQGYAILLARLDESHGDPPPALVEHFVREAAAVWPMLVLAQRSPEARISAAATRVLRKLRTKEAAPFFLSLLRRPGGRRDDEALAAAYVAVKKPDRSLIDELVGYLTADKLGEAPLHDLHATRARCTTSLAMAAAALLVPFADDERVFSGYLKHFGATHPHARKALRKRMHDPRVVPALHALLEHERREALAFQEGKHPSYREAFAAVATALAELGDAAGIEAKSQFEASERYWKTRAI